MLKADDLKRYDVLKDTRTNRLYFYHYKSEEHRNYVCISGTTINTLETGSISLEYLELVKDIKVSEFIRSLEYGDKLIDLTTSKYVYFNRLVVVDNTIKIEVIEEGITNNKSYINSESAFKKSQNSEDYMTDYEERLLLLLEEGKLQGISVSMVCDSVRFEMGSKGHVFNLARSNV